ncbi:branched-chain amino acid ABC transporter permease [Sedimentibacter hydroxybenzoicus DSM 7310]|uniref:Branched-chain amino acid ABC transporter permease n=1 Tax=Sedimentibacter hydroxybenzoicus DSM 7310 TaxID=1123245 RepID=A0A974GXK4_SEDHY|nr:branched-chain amino acid ABC transporter permease [Sedimentibacter hydroxybenzoicus]NYB75699.1 branched-chain amino acid ABC transporter permease [Sedimentibacter hydroxybenzoicus DSM 7310]
MKSLREHIQRDFSKNVIIALSVLLIALLIFPKFSSYTMLNLLTRIFVISVFAMSYDILRGYMGFINLGHAVYFGGGAYVAGILYNKLGTTIPVFILSIAVVVLYSVICALVMGKLSFKKGTSVFAAAMLTLALAEVVRNIAESWRDVTNGTDGLIFKVPSILSNRIFFYYFSLIFLIVMFIILRKFILSPTGRVIIAIRENEQRAEFLGFRIENYKLIAILVSGVSAGLAGLVFGTFNRFANTELLSITYSTNALLYTLIGGTGTLYGGIVGSIVVNVFQNMLLNLRSIHPIFERWLIFLGILYIAVILFMPKGIVGTLRHFIENRKVKSDNEKSSKTEKAPGE